VAPRPSAEGARVAVGRVRRAHGVRGELVVEPYGDDLDRFRALGEVCVGDEAHTVTAVRPHQGMVLMQLEAVCDRTAAAALAGAEVTVPGQERAPLPQGRYYLDDLVGLTVVAPDGRALGQVREVLRYPAQDLLRLDTPAGEGLVPMVRAFVLSVDLVAGRIVVDAPPGLLPEREGAGTDA